MGSDTDRYSIDPLDGPAAMSDYLHALERRLAALEGAPLVGSQLRTLDADGNTLVSTGQLDDGSYGIEVHSSTGAWDLVRATTDGWIAPHLQGAPYDPTAAKLVTSATFADERAVLFGDALGPGVEVMIPWQTDAATTGELQVTSNSGATTSTHALAAASNGYAFVRWLHGFTVGTGPLDLHVQARRVTGAGNVTVFPCHAWIQHPDACSSAGTWV